MKTDVSLIFLRILLAAFAFCLGLSCLAPLVLRRILNIGNSVGMALSALLLLYAFFLPQTNRILLRLWKHPFGKTLLLLLITFVSVCFLLFIAINFCMIRAAHTAPEPDSTVIILGCKVYDTRPSVMLERRLQAALSYLEGHPEASCILSGGKGPDEGISEAECMYTWLCNAGIDPKRLYLEAASTSTRENLLYSSEIIKKEGLSPRLAIVTNEFHAYRASVIADKLSLSNSSIPAKTPLWLFPTYYLRELFGVMYEWVF